MPQLHHGDLRQTDSELTAVQVKPSIRMKLPESGNADFIHPYFRASASMTGIGSVQRALLQADLKVGKVAGTTG